MLISPAIANCASYRKSNQLRQLPKTESGFSMLELMIVVSIVLVLTAIAVYNVQPAIRAVRLHGAASDYGDLLQNARIRAVKDDKYYTVLTNPGTCGGRVSFFSVPRARGYLGAYRIPSETGLLIPSVSVV